MSATTLPLAPDSPPRPARRPTALLRTRRGILAAAAAFLAVWAVLAATHKTPAVLPIPKPAVIAHLRADPTTAKVVARLRFDHVRITDIDSHYEAVWLFNGSRVVLTAVLRRDGSVAYEAVNSASRYAYGSNIANDWRVLVLLSVVFMLMTAVWPLARLRNLDVLVTTATVLGLVFLNSGRLQWMALAAYPAMLYLALRCGWRAFAPSPRAGERPRAVPLFEQVTSRWSDARRLRMLQLITGAAVLIVAMVGISSQGVVDVGYAVMEGATAIVHGVLPYGHIPDVLHGDTYPIGSYLLYVPLAALSPVHSQWDSADVTLTVAVGVTLLAAWGLWRAFLPARAGTGNGRVRRSEAERATALRAVVAFLSFPPLLATISTGTTDVVLCAIFLAAMLLWRRPTISTSLLAAGAWFKLAPVALLPLWLAPLRGRRLAHAVAGIAGVSALFLVPLLALGGVHGIVQMLHGISYQQSRDSLDSAWGFIGSVPLQQLTQTATIALIVVGAVMLRRDPRLAGDRTRVAALCGAVMLGLEISASYWTYMYLVWVLPFLVLSVLAPVELGGNVEPQPAGDPG
jgi:hypothetical protein